MSVASKLGEYNLKYQITLGLYMLEPWERAVFNSVMLLGFLLTTYATYNYFSTFLL
ncbi:hypothetical protein BGZ73_005006 [Actinomortierella ambigua]|nr:hypothetical protein BGZ73_005006 [Actinomortierella ambigua]